MMTVESEAGRLRTKGNWVLCPVCRRGKLLKLQPETRAKNLAVFCRVCKTETIINIGE